MSESSKDLKAELEKGIARLATLRDEVRVRAHLGSMDLQKQWDELEPRIESAIDRATQDMSSASHAALREVTEALDKLKARLS